MTPTSVKEMEKKNSRDAVGLQRLDTKKRKIKMEKPLDTFHQPDDCDKAYRDDETAQKPPPLLLDFAVIHQLVLNL